MLDKNLIAQLATELDESERSRVQVEHFSKRYPGMTIEDGYAISRAWVEMKIAAGRSVRGHKIGLTSRAMQQSSQIDEPDFGTLLDDMFFEAGDIPAGRFIAPRVEVELAFVLKRKLEGTNIGIEQVLDATDYVQPAIEIIDARIEQFDRQTKAMRKVQDTISDNAANAGIVMAGRKVGPRELDLPWVGAILRQNGVVEETGLAAGVQGHPAIGVAWLAMKLAPWGECLEPGQTVLAGSFTRPVAARPGDAFAADYGPLGRFSFRLI
jgi:2-oxo-hept-3-ene-1,7-dioate hydratase